MTYQEKSRESHIQKDWKTIPASAIAIQLSDNILGLLSL